MPKLLEPTGDAVALSAATIDALIARGSGDASLLYLYLLRHNGHFTRPEALKATGWETLRLDSALLHLQELGLAGPERPGAPQPGQESPDALRQEDAPEYTSADITEALEQPDTEFAQLLHLVEGSLGRKLSVRELKILYELLDYLAFPAEVVLTLVQWQIDQAQRKHGPGARPTMTTIRSRAYYWKRSGIDTQEAADAFLKKQELQSSQMGQLLAACAIRGREPTDGERRYLEQWIAWGITPELAESAYDVTVTNTGQFRWSYCHRVVENWHGKGIATPEQAKAESRPPLRKRRAAKAPVAPAPAPAQPAPGLSPEEEARQAEQSAKRTAWIQKMLNQAPEGGQSGTGGAQDEGNTG